VVFLKEKGFEDVVKRGGGGGKVERTGKVVKGIIGLSPVSSVLDLDTVLLGVVKLLLKRWFDSSYHRVPFYLRLQIEAVDATLLKQRPPSEFSRRPSSIKKHLSYWKASELRNWMLYYSLPLLLDHLPPLYFHHYALLVGALHLLLGDRIPVSYIDIAEQMLNDFCLLVEELYGESACTHMVHLLTHLTKYVHLWGPLLTHSMFSFESQNGYLKKIFFMAGTLSTSSLFLTAMQFFNT